MASLASLRLPLWRLSAPWLLKSRPATAAHTWQQSRSHRLYPTKDEMYEKTTVTGMVRDVEDGLFIEKYSSAGFIINGDQVMGPCALLPHIILQWNVASYKDISVESLSLFHLLVPRIEILVLGIGDRIQRLDPAIARFMREKGVAMEVQDTPNACATYNFLISERRVTAAGLIPVSQQQTDHLY